MRTILAAAVLAALSLLPGAGAALARADRDCPDFSSQRAAQRALDADPRDSERLDRDNDGVACEDHLYPPSSSPAQTTSDDADPAGYDERQRSSGADTDSGRTPAGPIEAGGGGTAGSDDSLPLLGAGLGGLAVGGVLVAGRRALRSRR